MSSRCPEAAGSMGGDGVTPATRHLVAALVDAAYITLAEDAMAEATRLHRARLAAGLSNDDDAWLDIRDDVIANLRRVDLLATDERITAHLVDGVTVVDVSGATR